MKDQSPELLPANAAASTCACQASSTQVKRRDVRVQSFERFIQFVESDPPVKIGDMDYDLMDLFSGSGHKTSDYSDGRVFESALRSVMIGFDRDFLYHHWLLAQLRWRAILTTNFDSFHERAAWAAMSSKTKLSERNAVL